MITEAQREKRRQSIGSSDAAAILGIDPYRTAYDLWLEKTGRVAGFEGNAVTERGSYLEAGILAWASDRLGVQVVNPKGPMVFGRLRAHVDGMVGKWSKGQPIVEAKNMVADGEWGKEMTDQVPPPVFVQVQHQMICAESELCYVARLSGGQGMAFSLYEVRPDPEIQRAIIEQSDAFWELYVETDTPPPYTKVSDSMLRYMSNIERGGDQIQIEPDHIRMYFEWKATYDEAEERVKYHRARVLEQLGDHSCGVCDGYQAKIINVRGGQKFHLGTLKKQFPHVYEQCLQESSGYSYLKVRSVDNE